MAWRFRLAAKNITVGGVDLLVQYFDDSNPAEILNEKLFSFEPGTLKNEAVGEVKLYGRKTRDNYVQAVQLGDNFTVGEEGPV